MPLVLNLWNAVNSDIFPPQNPLPAQTTSEPNKFNCDVRINTKQSVNWATANRRKDQNQDSFGGVYDDASAPECIETVFARRAVVFYRKNKNKPRGRSETFRHVRGGIKKTFGTYAYERAFRIN